MCFLRYKAEDIDRQELGYSISQWLHTKAQEKNHMATKNNRETKKKQVNSDQLSQMERKQTNIVINVVHYQIHVTHGGWENYLEKCEGLNLDSW